MSEQNLHEAGWRQGTIATGTFEATWTDLDENGDPISRSFSFTRGVVCTQDCDLSASKPGDSEQRIEVRPIRTSETPSDWGIRSRNLRLTDSDHVNADDPRAFVTPTLLAFGCSNESWIGDSRATALKTWLGLRFDRPAVPEHLVGIAKEVAKRCGSKSGRSTAAGVHDVLVQFDDSSKPPQVALFAVVTDDADQNEVRTWLADAASRIAPELGVVAHIDVATRKATSLELIETSYAADLSQVTWRGEEPTGAQ